MSGESWSPVNTNQLSDTPHALGRDVCGKKVLLKSLHKHKEILTWLKAALSIIIQVICTVFLQQKPKDPAKFINSSYQQETFVPHLAAGKK